MTKTKISIFLEKEYKQYEDFIEINHNFILVDLGLGEKIQNELLEMFSNDFFAYHVKGDMCKDGMFKQIGSYVSQKKLLFIIEIDLEKFKTKLLGDKE
jgi:hypothetical protein